MSKSVSNVDVMGDNVAIPCLVNSRVVKAGDYLRYCRPAAADATKAGAKAAPKPKAKGATAAPPNKPAGAKPAAARPAAAKPKAN